MHTQTSELVFDDESELQNYLEDSFEDHGWTAIQEVSPDHSDYRVDLLLKHDRFGTIGMELKYIEPGDSAGKIADAHKQITHQYWNRKYFGEDVDLWAACIYEKYAHVKSDDEWKRTQVQHRQKFAREFLCRYGIGILRLHRFAEIDFGHSIAEHKIPCFPITQEVPLDRYEQADVESIRESVRRKQPD